MRRKLERRMFRQLETQTSKQLALRDFPRVFFQQTRHLWICLDIPRHETRVAATRKPGDWVWALTIFLLNTWESALTRIWTHSRCPTSLTATLFFVSQFLRRGLGFMDLAVEAGNGHTRHNGWETLVEG